MFRCRGGLLSEVWSVHSRLIAGLLFVGKVGAGAFAGLTITANILMPLVIDRYGLFGMQVHDLSGGQLAGAALMVGGIVLISKF
jgi:bacterial/archaeal transporter family-2 protein